jgi:hypothetical protein
LLGQQRAEELNQGGVGVSKIHNQQSAVKSFGESAVKAVAAKPGQQLHQRNESFVLASYCNSVLIKTKQTSRDRVAEDRRVTYLLLLLIWVRGSSVVADVVFSVIF